MYIILGILVLVVLLVFTGNKSVHHEISINADADRVWSVLTDMERYPEWNPVMQLVDGEVKEGNKVSYRFTQDAETESTIAAKVITMEPNRLLNQKGGIPLVLTFDHQYRIIANGQTTTVIIHEDYRGIGVNFWTPAPVEAAYARLNQALKARAEETEPN